MCSKKNLVSILVFFVVLNLISECNILPKENLNTLKVETEMAEKPKKSDTEVLSDEKVDSPELVNECKCLNEENEAKRILDYFTHEALPDHIIEKITGVSWKEGSPVSLEELSYIRVLHWGFDNKEHEGELIVHKELALEVVAIFKVLYQEKFPVKKIRLVDEYDADDNLSMEDNNSSAFNFREITGKKGVLSKHSFGVAIDINPVQNPYIRGNMILPLTGSEYVNRENVRKGMVVKGDVCYRVFKEFGWTWGGDWQTLKDYQHFEKKIDLNDGE
ncbi:MAG: M15 family metallopeptidase [Alkaliphilus sp.]